MMAVFVCVYLSDAFVCLFVCVVLLVVVVLLLVVLFLAAKLRHYETSIHGMRECTSRL